MRPPIHSRTQAMFEASDKADEARKAQKACPDMTAGRIGKGGKQAYSGHDRMQDFGRLMEAVLAIDGVPAAVRLANAATAHRFTGVYRFDDQWLTNLYLCDWQNGSVTVSPAMPVHETYCVYILQSGHAFTVLDSQVDPRLAGHPKRKELRSYCGAPLLNQHGEVAGTVCHFDPEPGKLQACDFEQVHIAAALLQDLVLAGQCSLA